MDDGIGHGVGKLAGARRFQVLHQGVEPLLGLIRQDKVLLPGVPSGQTLRLKVIS